ncbi:MAG: hypothetical protein GF331_02680 [Chitinivibrionales bacterium]|nr:hypothetical protein [Chitinivibrionales bacterium]
MSYPTELPRELSESVRTLVQQSVDSLSDAANAKKGLGTPKVEQVKRYNRRTGETELVYQDADRTLPVWDFYGLTWAKPGEPPPGEPPPLTLDPEAGALFMLDGQHKVILDNFLYLNKSQIHIDNDDDLPDGATLNMNDGKVTHLANGEVSAESTDAVNGGQLHEHTQAMVTKRVVTGLTTSVWVIPAQAPIAVVIYDAAGNNVTSARGVWTKETEVRTGSPGDPMAPTDKVYIAE